MAAKYNLIWFNSHKNIAIKKYEKRKKISNKNTRCNRVRLKNAYVSKTLNLQQLRLIRNTKNSFTLVELGPLHKNGLPSLSVTRVTAHSKRVSDNTLKNVSITAQKSEHYNSRKCLQEDHKWSSWENREKLDWV
jgi:hypothetical protein